MGQEVFLTIDADKQPYIKASLTLEDRADPARLLDIGLKRGVWVAGRVTDAANGKPVKATIHYCPARDNPHVKDCPDAPFLNDRLPMGAVGDRSRRPLPRRRTPRPGPSRRAVPRARLPENAGRSTRSGPRVPPPVKTSLPERFISGLPADRPARGQGPGHPGDPARARTDPAHPHHRPGGPAGGGGTRLQPPARWIDMRLRPLPGDDLTFSHEEPGHDEAILFFHEERSIGGVGRAQGRRAGSRPGRPAPTGTVTGRLVDERGMPRANVT